MKDKSNIFVNEDFRLRLEEQTKKLSSNLVIYSAFVKINALKWLADLIPSSTMVQIIARWQVNDLVVNASDIEAYSFCKNMGWQFGIQNTLHSKVFIFDKTTIFVGSANLTDRGLSISKNGNIEIGTILDANIQDLSKLDKLAGDVIWLNDNLFEHIYKHINGIKENTQNNISWSKELKLILEKPINFLWINELFWTSPDEILNPNLDNKDHQHDIDLLDLDIQYLSPQLIDQKFINSNAYKFLLNQIENSDENKHKNFGWVTHLFHNAVLDDPPPYRSSIKHYVKSLFAWLEWSSLSKIKLKKFEHTTGLYLDNNMQD